jgi:hypothetical protein
VSSPLAGNGGREEGSGARGKGNGRGLNRRRPSGDITVMHEMLAVVRCPWTARVRRGAAGGPPVRGAPRASTARRARPWDNSEGLRAWRMGRRVPRATVALGGAVRTPRPAGARSWREDAHDVAHGGAPV